MLKWIILILISCTTVSGVQIQYSEDNLSWKNVTSVDENVKEGYQFNLGAGKLYYIRAKNGTSDWYYTSQRTKEGGMNQMEIALAIFSVLFIIIGLYLLLMKR